MTTRIVSALFSTGGSLLPWLPIAAAAILVAVILATGYVKSPPDQAYIISGLKKDSRILVGRAGIKVPSLRGSTSSTWGR